MLSKLKDVMKDRLLGTPPDQILESEKMQRLQEIVDRRVFQSDPERIIAAYKEEHELDRKYPDLPPERYFRSKRYGRHHRLLE